MSPTDHGQSYMVDTRRDEPLTQDVLPDGSVDPVYQAKAELLNDAIQEIGMGKYQVSVYYVYIWSRLICPSGISL